MSSPLARSVLWSDGNSLAKIMRNHMNKPFNTRPFSLLSASKRLTPAHHHGLRSMLIRTGFTLPVNTTARAKMPSSDLPKSLSRLYRRSESYSTFNYPMNENFRPYIRKLRPTIFSLLFCGGVFAYASFNSNDKKKSRGGDRDKDKNWWNPKRWVTLDPETSPRHLSPEARRVIPSGYRLRSIEHQRCVYRIASWPSWVPGELKRACIMAADKWYSSTAGERFVYGVVGLNLAIFGLWQVPRLVPFMSRHFLHDPRTGRSYTLLTSMFSHNELWHLGFNMMAFVSFSMGVSNIMGSDQFAAFYLSSGVLASLASHLGSAFMRTAILPSLGASGAIYAVVAATAFSFPTSKIMLIFLPFIPISIGHAFPALMAYDILGVILKWQRFDHIGHLGGAISGLAYMKWGQEKIWKPLTERTS